MSIFNSIIDLPQNGTNPKYVKKKLIGTGSYGEAWLVQRSADDATFVAKTMDLGKMTAKDKEYAHSEIKCLASCHHPNIIEYVEDHAKDGLLLIVMEFADSGDLDKQIKSRCGETTKYFQEHEVLFLFLQLCLAVDHIHSRKMLHRDIKSANVLLTSTGLIKLGDFGFSRQYEDTVSGVVANTFCGTPYYLAPELWNNKRYSKKADVWSLGVLLYEIMSLKKPFASTNMRGLMSKVLKGEYDPLPDKYSEEFRSVIREILVVNADDRPTVRDIFSLPYIKEGLKVFSNTVKKNNKITDRVKDALAEHVNEILASTQNVNARPISAPSKINKCLAYSGFVKKQKGSGSSASWKEKFLQIRSGHLILSDSESDVEGKALSLEQVQDAVPIPAETAAVENVFSLNTFGGKSMWFQASSKESMQEWILVLRNAIGAS